MYGEDFVRTASSLTGERVKEDPAFKPTMAYAAMLAKASWLASSVYAMLPNYRKKHSLYRKLTGAAMRLLKEGRGEGEAAVKLMISIRLPKKKRAVAVAETAPVAKPAAVAERCTKRLNQPATENNRVQYYCPDGSLLCLSPGYRGRTVWKRLYPGKPVRRPSVSFAPG
jgi:hypothetical protein